MLQKYYILYVDMDLPGQNVNLNLQMTPTEATGGRRTDKSLIGPEP